jgi:hypothetical protein
MAPHFRTLLTGHNVPRIIGRTQQSAPSIINEKTITAFARVVEKTGILKRAEPPAAPDQEPS